MTVPASKRTASKMDVHMALDDLVSHTLTKVANARKFGVCATNEVAPAGDGAMTVVTRVSPGHLALGRRIEDAAVAAGELAWRANDVRVADAASYAERRRMQDQAVREVDALLYLVRLTRKHCGLTGREVKAWSDKATRARDLLRKWRDSDARRYGHLRESGM